MQKTEIKRKQIDEFSEKKCPGIGRRENVAL